MSAEVEDELIRHMHEWEQEPMRLGCTCGLKFDNPGLGNAVRAWAQHVASAIEGVADTVKEGNGE